MYKGYQEELFKNPWGCNQGFSHLNNNLNDLIPLEGRCEFPNSKNKALDKFRRAQNAAYDLFNNGLGNKRSLFQNIYGWSVGVRDTSYATKMQWSMWEDRVEEVLTPIMLEAAKEQGVTNDQC
tara:strand:- start:109 stop:477 length:369 start_codon:yes stop_codon:yes gene_type:complete